MLLAGRELGELGLLAATIALRTVLDFFLETEEERPSEVLGVKRGTDRATLEALMREVDATARAHGVPLPDDAVARTLAFADRMPADATSSMHRDLVAGRPNELDAQVGAVCRLAARHGVDVRLHDLLYEVLG